MGSTFQEIHGSSSKLSQVLVSLFFVVNVRNAFL